VVARAAFLLAGTSEVGAASAQGWPTRTVNAIIRFAPGNADVLDTERLAQQAGIETQ
jgi:hypothetical protein